MSASSTGGAWEAIIDKAVTQVTEYLTITTRDFDPSAPLSAHMLNLLDRGTLRDVLVERNYNELCGCLGCGNKPRGLQWGLEKSADGTLSFDWPSSTSSSSSSDVDGDKEDEDVEREKTEGRARGTGSSSAAQRHDAPPPGEKDPEEIVYEDDLYTAESFRLAQRQRAALNRMQHTNTLREEKRQQKARAGAASAPARGGSSTAVAPRVRSSGLLGASFPQRFCSPECEEMYSGGIVPRVSACMSYDYPTVFSAVTNLFPNLSVAALQQLAGAEVSASWLVKPIQESNVQAMDMGHAKGEKTGAATLNPVQIGVSYESNEHRGRARQTNMKSTKVSMDSTQGNAAADDQQQQQQQPLLRDVLSQMQVLQGVWNHEVVPRFSASHLPRMAADVALPPSASAALSTRTVAATAAAIGPGPRPTLRGPLLLFDFIMNTSGAKTRRLFRAHYAKHRTALQMCVSRASRGQSSPDTFFGRVSQKIITAMEEDSEKRIRREKTHSVKDEAEEDDDLRIDPALQQQRRELLTAHMFSDDVTATLSRLLLVDYVLLLQVAWSGVWFADLPLKASDGTREACSLLRSLRFPFAIPAVLLRSAGSSPEVMGLAMIFLAAAGCCSPAVWNGCHADEVAFEEVAEVIGLSEDDVTAAVRSLMLGEEDE